MQCGRVFQDVILGMIGKVFHQRREGAGEDIIIAVDECDVVGNAQWQTNIYGCLAEKDVEGVVSGIAQSAISLMYRDDAGVLRC